MNQQSSHPTPTGEPTAQGGEVPTASPAGGPAFVPEPQAETEKKVAAIDVSPKAVEAIRRQLQKRGTPDAALRLGIKGGGCSGFSYAIEFHDGPPRARDRVFTFDGVTVVVDPKSLLYLNGSMLDWEQTLMFQGFKFKNPQEKTSCGCGHSFTV
jgi:iron-sulfur cluster assembly protein